MYFAKWKQTLAAPDREALVGAFGTCVFVECVSVKEGDSVILHTDHTEIHKDGVIDWRFGAESELIARIRQANDPSIYDDALNRTFRDRLKLNNQEISSSQTSKPQELTRK
ncbi:tRNA (guanine-N(7)-)-methyltransferase [Labeo rohita]|uniref:tRNA (Guanine-N(7)-)-methyltransferase n=1 Tax=Labeo rohita TaxID=84645 RepID=A0ABQ8L8Y2_LABRO|nr:tRNA (guanine-N(7)-)-methyltransferase [Labeo rohita]